MMQKQIEGIVEEDGRIKLLDPTKFSPSQRVSVSPVNESNLQTENQDDWREKLRAGFGMWKDRDDIPELMAQVRRESSRVEPPDDT